MLLNSIFSFSHNVFYLIKSKYFIRETSEFLSLFYLEHSVFLSGKRFILLPPLKCNAYFIHPAWGGYMIVPAFPLVWEQPKVTGGQVRAVVV